VAAKTIETRDVIWPFDEQIKASGLLRVRDYGNATLLYRWSEMRSQMRMSFLLLELALLAMFIFLSCFAVLQKPWDWPAVGLCTLLITAVYLVFVQPYAASWRSIKRIRSAGIDPTKWTFSWQGIHIEDDHSDTNLKWDLVTQAVVTTRYVLLGLGTGPYHTFASPMFSTQSDWHNFRSAIIRNFVGCRACGYDLRGTVSDTCPECGKPID
jgi:hypothetical protein